MRFVSSVFALLLLSFGLGCSDDDEKACTGSNDPEELSGSFCEGSEIRFDTIQIGYQAMVQTLRIRFAEVDSDTGALNPSLDVEVATDLVESLGPNVSIPFGTAAFVRWWPSGASQPQQLTSRLAPTSNLVFDRISLEIGSSVSGSFSLLIDNSRTLQSRFTENLVAL